MTELAERLGLHKSTVHRFLVNLEAGGLVERNARTARYRLGLRIFELGGLVLQQMNLWDEALPFLEGLVRESGETGHLAVLDGGEAIYIEKVEARRALRVPSAMGRGYPAHATSLGKALLAGLPAGGAAAAGGRARPRRPHAQHDHRPRRARDGAPARCATAATRSTTRSTTRACAASAPAIHDHTGQVVAALGIGGPVTRVTPARVEELARARDGRRPRPLTPARRAPVRGLRPRGAAGPHHRRRSRCSARAAHEPPTPRARTTHSRQFPPTQGDTTTMATTATNPLRLSSRTSHFVLPKQWASMRKAEALERETGKRVIHFEKGDFQGDEFRPAPHIMEACAKAVADGHVRYVPGPGLPELRDAIAEEATKRGRPTVREEVLVTMGAKHALTQSLLTIVDQGDEVIFPNPGYPPDEFWITYAGGTVVYAPLVEPDFHFDLDSLRSLITPKTKMLIINSPQRPNGMTVGQLDEIAAICAEHNVIVLTDEIFSHMVYSGAEHRTIAAVEGMADRSILVDTFSKTYIMTGFRIGWCVANKDLITTMDIFQQNSVTNVPAFVQLAALAAITGPQDHVEVITKKLAGASATRPSRR